MRGSLSRRPTAGGRLTLEAVNEADIEAALDEPRSIASLRSEASEAEEEAQAEVAALAKAEAARFEAEERAAAAQLELAAAHLAKQKAWKPMGNYGNAGPKKGTTFKMRKGTISTEGLRLALAAQQAQEADEVAAAAIERAEEAAARAVAAANRADEAEMEAKLAEVMETMPMAERKFSYDSLQEHLLRHSLRRAIRRRDWRYAGWITVGWTFNLLIFVGLMLIFTVYGCRFKEEYAESEALALRIEQERILVNGSIGNGTLGSNATGVNPDEALMVSWLWSVGQRFLVNEPFIILFGALVPLLFASAFCSNLCTESCNNTLTVAVTIVVTCLKSLRRVGG